MTPIFLVNLTDRISSRHWVAFLCMDAFGMTLRYASGVHAADEQIVLAGQISAATHSVINASSASLLSIGWRALVLWECETTDSQAVAETLRREIIENVRRAGAVARRSAPSQSRAVALDLESAAVAANGFRFRVPYGTLLCISDKPLHGDIKLAGMASEFYRRQIGQHLEIGLNALEKLQTQKRERLHSRKLRSFAEVAFQ